MIAQGKAMEKSIQGKELVFIPCYGTVPWGRSVNQGADCLKERVCDMNGKLFILPIVEVMRCITFNNERCSG